MRYTTLISLLMVCNISIAAEKVWVADKYDVQAYESAMKIYEQHRQDRDDELVRYEAISDSIMNVGKSNNNYAQQYVALMMKEQICISKNAFDEIPDIEQQRMRLAKEHSNATFYFESFYKYCFCLVDTQPSEAFFLAKQMVDEAIAAGSESGMMYGHMALGDISLMSRYDGPTAVLEYEKALSLAESLNSNPVKLLQLSTDLARAYMECKQYDKAKDILDKFFGTPEVLEDEYAKLLFYSTYIFVIENDCTREEYNRFYQKYINTPEMTMLYDEGSILYFKVRWLMKMERYKEALESVPLLPLKRMQLESLINIYKGIGQHEKAFGLLEELCALDDSIRREVGMGDIAAMNARLSNMELQRKIEQSKVHRNYMIGTMVFILLISVIVIFIFRQRHQRKVNHMQRLHNERLQRANSAKDIFLKNMTHELHTPLSQIYGFAQVLADENFPIDEASTREMGVAIREGSKQLTAVLDNIVDVTDKLSKLDKLEEVESILKEK